MSLTRRLVLTAVLAIGLAAGLPAKTITLKKDVLKDKIRGGWAGQVIGCTFGGPTEFRFQGTFIQDYQPIAWDDAAIARAMKNEPGLYDDVYMDLTFVSVFAKEGLDAPAASFARAFATAPYPLWHANQMGRYNILRGIKPPLSGAWPNNPHADDIDFQIESDFAGLMSPGMVEAASEFCDRVGHIMNSGDGWYGGVYVAAMYALAFTSDDPVFIATEALKAVPAGSSFHAVMSDVLRWYRENPGDWHETWFRVQKKWSEDIGCPEGVFSPFNIDAKINAAWVLVGLLYGGGDFAKTLEISARCGDDSDCNPATAGGILGTALGYARIPDRFKSALAPVESVKFPYTELTLADVDELSFNQALAVIRKHHGTVGDSTVTVETGEIRPVRLEVNFPGLRPAAKRSLGLKLVGDYTLEFEGCGIVVDADTKRLDERGAEPRVQALVDGKVVETFEVPTGPLVKRDPVFWIYNLASGRHTLVLRRAPGGPGVEIILRDAVIYAKKAG